VEADKLEEALQPPIMGGMAGRTGAMAGQVRQVHRKRLGQACDLDRKRQKPTLAQPEMRRERAHESGMKRRHDEDPFGEESSIPTRHPVLTMTVVYGGFR
ncbi:hypothetical protein, partial [Ensifer soli]|uniref:hypothetical protein n=1 Tax=Ciceribacter sp. sgz301302 TaxID=3342379 RepID=UPI0035B816D0